MKAILLVFFLCLAAAAAQQANKKLNQKLFPKRKWHHWKEKQHEKLCKNLECQIGEGCKVLRNGTATCIRCIDCTGVSVDPVCGSDGRQYNSMCHFRQQICLQDKIGLIKIQCHSSCSFCPGSPAFEEKKRAKQGNSSEQDQDDGYIKRLKKNKTKKWLKWSNMQEEEKPKEQCSDVESSSLAERLIDWFHVVRADRLREEIEKGGLVQPNFVFREMKPQEAKAPFPAGAQRRTCRDPINSMFDFLDENKNNMLDKSEIDEIKNIPYEHCIAKFFEDCDEGKDGMFGRMEFCDCFPVVPPCMRQRRLRTFFLKDDAPVLPGMYIPACDEDGFYMPKQCKSVDGGKECWCVDRNGGKIEGISSSCADNTKPQPLPEDASEE